MKLVSLKCPNCSGAVSFSENNETVECEYCGKELHFQEEVDKAQKANAAGIQEYTDRIYDLIRQEDYVSAGTLADEGLKTFPYSGRLHLSLLLSELNLKKPSLLGKVGKDYTSSIHYQNCIRYMTAEDKKDLLSLVELNKSVAPAPVQSKRTEDEAHAEAKKEDINKACCEHTEASIQSKSEPQPKVNVPLKDKKLIAGFGIAGFVLGVLSFHLGYLFCITPAVGLILSIVCAVKMKKYKMTNKLYRAGLILNCIFLAIYGIYFCVFIEMFI